MTALSEEEFKKYLEDISGQMREDKAWLIDHGVDAKNIKNIKSYKELESEVWKKCEEILQEWNWYKVSSINVVKSYMKEDGDLKIYRSGLRGKKEEHHHVWSRWYNPKTHCMYTYLNAMEIARNGKKDTGKENLVGMSKIMSESLEKSNIKLKNNDIVAFRLFNGKEKNSMKLHYLDKMNLNIFNQNKRFYTAQWIKKARNI